MWHSTHFTRACDPCWWAAISSGCTLWHMFAQNASLLLYSQPAMPAAPSRATATTATVRPSVPSTTVLDPILICMSTCSFLECCARFSYPLSSGCGSAAQKTPGCVSHV